MDGMMTQFLMMGAVIAVFYFILIRPQQRQRKQEAEMRNSLAVGDKIIAAGGIVGKVVQIKDDLITMETGEDRVRIEVRKASILNKL